MSLETVFLKVVNMSIAASFLILAVILVRLIFKKAPKWIVCILWGCVALRLLFPFSIESAFSLLPSSEPLPEEIIYTSEPMIESGIAPLDDFLNPILSTSMAPEPGASANPTQVWSFTFAAAWVLGMALLILYCMVSYAAVRLKVRESVPLRDNVRLCDRVPSPFILGIFRPTIYLPSAMEEKDAAYVIAHENAHLERRDHLWKPLGFVLLILHWFNPLVWLGYVLLCRDIEIACDEKVISTMEAAEKRQYSEVLLACSTRRRLIAACPLAFGEVGVKERIKNVLNYRKPAFWIIVLALIACIVTAVCFLTNPPSDVNERLAVFLDCQIAEHHQSDKSIDHYCALDYQLLGKRTRGDTVTVYMWVLYEEFSWDDELDGGVKRELGAHTVTAITAKKSGDAYELVEYWTPRDGAYNDDDIRDKLPMHMWADAMDSEKYYKIQAPILAEMAYEHYTSTANIGGADAPQSTIKRRKLQLVDVIALSKKGMALTWEDFAPFSRSVIYNGLDEEKREYTYNISDTFRLIVTGTKQKEKPLSVMLYAFERFEETRYIDIRREDAEAFIVKTPSPVKPRPLTLDDVFALAEKGERLTMDDLKPFVTDDYSGPGGLYHHVTTQSFPIDDSFCLYVGMSSKYELLFATLHATLHDTTVDVQSGDVRAFIEKHKEAPTHVHTFTDGQYYTTHTALASVSYADPENSPRIPLRYHEIYRDCADCGYTEYLGWAYCGTGKGHSDNDCTGECGNVIKFNPVSTKLATEYLERAVFNSLLLSFESSSNEENIKACIEENREAYDRLLAYNDFTLRYIFKCFIAGGQTGLRGEILRALLDDLVPEHAIGYGTVPAQGNAQMYFAAWKASAQQQWNDFGEEEIERSHPAGALLIRMLNMR